MKTFLMIFFLLTGFVGCVSKPPAHQESLNVDEANVVGVKVSKDVSGYTFRVTVLHNDTGWEHYVDWWRIKTPRRRGDS